jgi:hypothetical protein
VVICDRTPQTGTVARIASGHRTATGEQVAMRKPTRLVTVAVAAAALLAGAAAPAHAASPLQIRKVYYDSPGADDRSNRSLNAEYVVIKNVSTTRRSLTGWTLRDIAGWKYTFGTFSLAAGKSVYVHTGRGTNTASHRYWGRRAYVWNNTGDKAYLRNSAGTLKDSCAWSSKGSGYVYC